MGQMDGKIVAITGASRGIGASAAKAFAREGAKVALIARSREKVQALAAEIGEAALALPCDVSRFTEIDSALRTAAGRFGGLDVLINNAGVIEPISMMRETDPEDWSRTIDINLKGVFYGMRAALPLMAGKGGTVITVSSGAAHNPLEGWSAYCTSKAGAAMLTMCLDKEARGRGIRAMGLSPGTVATDMQREIKQSGVNPVSQLDWSEHIPPEWPAEALLWMCSEDADDYVGEEVRLRDEEIRRRVGLIK